MKSVTQRLHIIYVKTAGEHRIFCRYVVATSRSRTFHEMETDILHFVKFENISQNSHFFMKCSLQFNIV